MPWVPVTMSARCNHVFKVPIGAQCQAEGCAVDMGKPDSHGHTSHRIETEIAPGQLIVTLVCREHCPEHRTRDPLPDRATIETIAGDQGSLFNTQPEP